MQAKPKLLMGPEAEKDVLPRAIKMARVQQKDVMQHSLWGLYLASIRLGYQLHVWLLGIHGPLFNEPVTLLGQELLEFHLSGCSSCHLTGAMLVALACKTLPGNFWLIGNGVKFTGL